MDRILKLITCNGRTLEVRGVGPVVYRLVAAVVPIKLHGDSVLEDDAAPSGSATGDLVRDLVRVQREANDPTV